MIASYQKNGLSPSKDEIYGQIDLPLAQFKDISI